MPTDSVNIYLTMTDKASPVLVSVGDKTRLLEKETAKLIQSYNALQKTNAPPIPSPGRNWPSCRLNFI